MTARRDWAWLRDKSLNPHLATHSLAAWPVAPPLLVWCLISNSEGLRSLPKDIPALMFC